MLISLGRPTLIRTARAFDIAPIGEETSIGESIVRFGMNAVVVIGSVRLQDADCFPRIA
jgi:hypothetical protein